MLYIEPKSMDAAFHFSVEEYVMRDLRPDGPALMLWRTDRTAMIGANQIAEIEVDISYANENYVMLVRRSSGGGTIYTDHGTVLYTIILPFTDRTDTKAVIADYLAGPVIGALRSMGVSASLEGRNDILVDGRKISGIAQYVRYGYLCSHGSLLYDADLGELVRVITVDDEKIRSKALRSVRSRVTNIAEHAPSGGAALYGAAAAGGAADTAGFIARLRGAWDAQFGLAVYELTDADLAAVETIRVSKYASDAWTFGRTPRYTFRNARRFAGGGVEVFAEVRGGVMESVRITGDFLALRPVDGLEEKLAGVPFRPEAIAAALTEEDAAALGTITRDELVSVFG